MNPVDIIIKEYEIANDRYKFYSNAKTTFLGFFLTFSIVFFTFLIKGDLPPSMYLLLAAIIFIFSFFQNYLIEKQVTAWRLWYYLEKKANFELRLQGNRDRILDLGEKTLYLGYGPGRHTIASRITQYSVVLAILAMYEFCIWKGCAALTLKNSAIFIVHAAYYVAVLVFTAIAFLQNKMRKNRFEEIISKINSQKTT